METILETVKEDIHNFLQSYDKVFTCEDDLKMNLAIYLKKNTTYKDVLVEYYVPVDILLRGIDEKDYPWSNNTTKNNDRINIDIVVVSKDDKYVPIELKYTTRGLTGNAKILGKKVEACTITRNQAAQNIRSYDFWKDVKRIECLKKSFDAVEGGIAVFLTNDSLYWKSRSDEAVSKKFEITNNSGKSRKWAVGSQKYSNRPEFSLAGSYPISEEDWFQAKDIDSSNLQGSSKRQTPSEFKFCMCVI